MEAFIKVMNGLVMTLEDDKRFLCVWLRGCSITVSNFADSRMEVLRYRTSPTSRDHFFLCFGVFSSGVACVADANYRRLLFTGKFPSATQATAVKC